MEVYEKNLKAFSEGYPKEAALLKKNQFEENHIIVNGINTGQGAKVLQVTDENGRKLMLDGVYGAEKRIEEQIQSWGKLSSRTPFFVVGISNLEHIRAYLKAVNNECLMFVYEPCIEIFKYVMEHIDISDLILNSPAVFLIEGLNGENLRKKYQHCLSWIQLQDLRW